MRNLCIVAAEFTHMPRLAKRRFKGYVKMEGIENIDFSRGALLMSGHVGNWEWLASVMSSRGHVVTEVVRPLDDLLLNSFIDRVRRGGMIETVPKNEAGTEVIRLLREGHLVGILVDQSPRNNGVPAVFFGHSCWATIAPVMVAVRARVPIHPVSIFRDDKTGQYTICCHPAMEMTRSNSLRQDIVDNTQRCQDYLEQMVRAHPEQWLWLHQRWKHRDRLQREWEAKMLKDR